MPDVSDLTGLVDRVREGDHDAFGDLYDELAPRVFGVVKRVLRDPAMSEEVTQDVFTEIWTTIDRYDGERASIAGWVTMIARRRAVDRVRAEQSRRNRHGALADEVVPGEPAPEAIVTDRDEATRVHAVLAELPADQQQVIRLAFLDGRSHGAIAETLGLPLGTVKGRVRLGLKRLRAGLGEER